jgi:hypothetical protein
MMLQVHIFLLISAFSINVACHKFSRLHVQMFLNTRLYTLICLLRKLPLVMLSSSMEVNLMDFLYTLFLVPFYILDFFLKMFLNLFSFFFCCSIQLDFASFLVPNCNIDLHV